MTDEPMKPLRKLLPEQVAGEPYPVTIVATRYSGSYEGGRYAAFLLEPGTFLGTPLREI
ncbi:hypothetical protein ACQEVF_47370 [Nonomuraea polychroma]|uniref:hypothetical protein n=1 Tax=Nonomuraea polychroma TaxID=46176 RepID=UPI003D92DCC0